MKNLKIKSVLNEDVPRIKSKQTEELRMIAQTMSTAKQSLKKIQSQYPSESGMEAIIEKTIKELETAQKTFLQVKNFI